MVDIRSVEMDEDERAAFLQTGGTGVISFGSDADEAPYSVPVSYGYDDVEGDFYFRLLLGSERGKEEPIEAGRPVSFVTYDQTNEGWKSVVASGELEEVSEPDIDSPVAQAIQRVHIPIVDVFDRHPRELTFYFFRLDPTDVSSRKEALTED
jgi:nitroimidazol reductase NimA-like FMN-containing flavoprotein (pyridoxamine 5'-phosphate oxidase superfamily)